MTEDHEPLNVQIDRLASFIIGEVLGEPSQNEGAIDTAIRIIREQQATPRPSEVLNLFMGWLTTRKEDSGPFSGSRTCSGQAVELIAEYCADQGWKEPRENWGKNV